MKSLPPFVSMLFVSLLSTGCAENSAHLTSTSWVASAAVAAVVSAMVSGGVALIVKDKEYKNDYFKKVIDKRIKAIEALEKLSSLFASYYGIVGTSKEYHAFFADNMNSEAFNKIIDSLGEYNIWYSTKTADAIENLTKFAGLALVSCEGKNEKERERIALISFQSIENYKVDLEASIQNDMASLHKVRRFFKNAIKELRSSNSKRPAPSLKKLL